MEPVKNPHDRFFKETFSRPEVALDFVYTYVPQPIAGLVAPETFKLSKDTFVDEELEERFSDLLYEAELKGRGRYSSISSLSIRAFRTRKWPCISCC